MKRNFYFSRNKGFTLIELLVVISIIGLLSSVVLATLNTTRIKARDAQRIAALRQIQNAIELYADDHGGDYPGYSSNENTFMRSPDSALEYAGVNGCGFGAVGASGEGRADSVGGRWCRFETALSPYIKSLPRTQLINGVYYNYIYKVPLSNSSPYNPTGVKTYGLSVRLESTNNNTAVNDGGFYNNYFELGNSPVSCKNRYSGAAAQWDYWNDYLCMGDTP
jgi:prepilin-type N-terminal cleavage/methylation domain-containing protein